VGTAVAVAVVITFVLVVVALNEGTGVGGSPAASYINHDPIYIDGDSSFTPANGVTSGSGTQSDPYIIENWVINAPGANANGIYIQNTTAYFVVRNCLVENGSANPWNLPLRPAYDGIYLLNVVNGEIENNTFRNDCNGISLINSSNNHLTNNTSENNWVAGIHITSSSNNTLTNNICMNSGYGIFISGFASEKPNHGGWVIFLSLNNTLSNNTCSNNEYGIYLGPSSPNNTLTRNTCENNNYGIYLTDSSGNTIFHNRLLNNTENNAYDDSANSWDENGMGNYWSDWQPPEHPDADNDGIVDEPRPIAGGTNQDNYPLLLSAVIPDFTISVSPENDEVVQGESATATISLTSVGGFSENVSLLALPPPGSSLPIFLSPSSGTPSFTSTLTISTASTTPAVTYSIIITGTGGGKTHECAYTLTVTAAPPTPFPWELVIGIIAAIAIVIVIVALLYRRGR
jgi:parallel beta-helix repeat protein